MNNLTMSVVKEARNLAFAALDSIQPLHQRILNLNTIAAAIHVQPSNKQNLKLRDLEAKRLFRDIHSFITHTAGISKLLHISNRDKAAMRARGSTEDQINETERRLEFIRQRLEIGQDSSLHHSQRALRDHLEHFNNRFLSLLCQIGESSDYRICNYDQLAETAQHRNEQNLFRTFVVDRGIYIFQGEEFDLNKVERDVRQVYDATLFHYPIFFAITEEVSNDRILAHLQRETADNIALSNSGRTHIAQDL